MDIHKLIKKDRKSYKLFLFIMILISVICPFGLLASGVMSKFLIIYLCVIECLIIFAVLRKINSYKLEYKLYNNRIKYKVGLFSKGNSIICDKIKLVHTVGSGNNIEIILITDVKLKSTYVKPITKSFYKKYPELLEKVRIIFNNEKSTLYYISINQGSFKKYLLLDTIYKNSVKAKYTDNAIENIKIARGQKKN